MVRWQPDARGRLGKAAMELYAERGYDQTTVADIADRAGLTARTFFRHFADKREVLFAGSDDLEAAMIAAVDASPGSAAPLEAVAAALDAVADVIGGNRAYSQARQAVITANAELRERELKKFHTLSGLLAEGLRRRGVTEPDASLAAETGMVVFRVGFERWLDDPADRPLADVMRDLLAQLRTITAVT